MIRVTGFIKEGVGIVLRVWNESWWRGEGEGLMGHLILDGWIHSALPCASPYG